MRIKCRYARRKIFIKSFSRDIRHIRIDYRDVRKVLKVGKYTLTGEV